MTCFLKADLHSTLSLDPVLSPLPPLARILLLEVGRMTKCVGREKDEVKPVSPTSKTIKYTRYQSKNWAEMIVQLVEHLPS